MTIQPSTLNQGCTENHESDFNPSHDFTLIAQNKAFVVINKSPGVDVHRDGDEPGITEKVSEALGGVKLYLVHRLDKVTSGLMILAKDATTCAELAELFRERQVNKYYLAVSARKPGKKQGWIIGDMARSRRGSWKLTSGKQSPAVTQFFSCSLKPGHRAFLLKPRTGKTHQLRVALKSIGAPICGDQLYDDAALASIEERTYLHAYQLHFKWQGNLHHYSAWPHQGEHFASDDFSRLRDVWSEPDGLTWPKAKGRRQTQVDPNLRD